MDEKVFTEVKGWVRDLAEVVAVLAVIIIISKILLGSNLILPLVAVTSCSMYHGGSLWNGVDCQSHGVWDTWLINKNITIDGFPFWNGFSKGDMIITVTPDGGGTILPLFPDTSLGDVVIYNRDKMHSGNEPIIHRVVGIVKVRDWEIKGVEGTLSCLSVEDFNDTYIPYVKDCVSGGRCPYRDYPKSGDFEFYITKGDNNPYPDQCGANGGIALPVTDEQLVARGWIRIPYLGWLKIALNKIIPI